MHEKYMYRALELAKKGEGFVSPNPLVGAIIVKDGEVIAEGYHKGYGLPHAEIDALNNAKESVIGSTIYVTLEPCCHYGKTPPCTDAIIKAGIKKVVVAMTDPNPLVAGKGIDKLRAQGISVKVGILENEAKELNRVFIKYIETGMPYVVMKYAMTLDGKIATDTGHSKYITGKEAREHVHEQRLKYRGILVGIETLIQDDPLLTARLESKQGRQPVAIIVDTKGRIPLDAKILDTVHERRVILATTEQGAKNKGKELNERGVEVLICKEKQGKIDFKDLLKEVAKSKVDSILVEGGRRIHGTLLDEKLMDYVLSYIAPRVIGGEQAPSPVGGKGMSYMYDAIELKNVKVSQLGKDLLMEGQVM